MAVETRVTVRCDMCSTEDAQHCAVIIGDERWNVDLCERHRQPLEKIAKIGTPAHNRQPMAPKSVHALDSRVRGLE